MAGRVLVAATSKGGAGKTTAIVSLAAQWRHAGRDVALVDVDPNQTLTRWHSKGGLISELTLRSRSNEHEIVDVVAELAGAHQLVLVDCPGFGNQAMIFAVGCADLVLIPVMTDEASVFEALRMKRVVESAAQLTRRRILHRALLSRVKRAGVVRHTRDQLDSLELKPLSAVLGDRTVFQEASYFGASPIELAPRSMASRETQAVARELEPLLFG
jgi:chromosome partitioning protein